MVRSEIGSEFWEIPLKKSGEDRMIPENASWFLSGRTALSFIIEDILLHRVFHTVALPSLCCHTMIEPFVQRGVEVQFYPVYPDDKGQLVQDLSQVRDCDGLLILDYFGYIRSVERDTFDGVIIRDVTHSLFCGVSEDADYVFGSLRKWAGFWTGGFAWKKDGTFFDISSGKTNADYVSLRQQAMEKKQQYIQGERNDKRYLELFAQAEELLDANQTIYAAAQKDIDAAQRIDVEYLRCRRRENAAVLLKNLGEFALFPELCEKDCPLTVPILVPDGKRDALRKYLIDREIYCPIHWPISELHQLDEQTKKFYQNELSLVCDQRYSVVDMERLSAVVWEFLG